MFVDFFKVGGEFYGLDWVCCQFDIGNMVIFEVDVDYQFIGVIVDGFNKYFWFKFGVVYVYVVDYCFYQ